MKFGSYKMELKWELCASRRKLSQHAGRTIVLDAECLMVLSFYNFHFNFHERSELTPTLTSSCLLA